MPIVINRNTGAINPQKITQEQRDTYGASFYGITSTSTRRR